MQIITKEVKDKPLTVTIEYPERTEFVDGLIRKIESLDISFSADDNGRQLKLKLAEVYYIENVERKLFVYGAKEVYRLNAGAAELEERFKDSGLVRISRTCIMNTDHLREIRQVKNSRLEALLDNEEMLIVSRKYLKDIKNVFKRG